MSDICVISCPLTAATIPAEQPRAYALSLGADGTSSLALGRCPEQGIQVQPPDVREYSARRISFNMGTICMCTLCQRGPLEPCAPGSTGPPRSLLRLSAVGAGHPTATQVPQRLRFLNLNR